MTHMAAGQALGYLAPPCLGVANEKAGGAMVPEAHCGTGLVADLFEEQLSLPQQSLGNNQVGGSSLEETGQEIGLCSCANAHNT
jgi:hypothetical protein